jgi:hypothetical protein
MKEWVVCVSLCGSACPVECVAYSSGVAKNSVIGYFLQA